MKTVIKFLAIAGLLSSVYPTLAYDGADKRMAMVELANSIDKEAIYGLKLSNLALKRELADKKRVQAVLRNTLKQTHIKIEAKPVVAKAAKGTTVSAGK